MTAAPPLDAHARARGRRLAITSHPFGMTFRTVFTSTVPTLALLGLGASESTVGVQSALVSAALVLQLPTLRLVARIPKRWILLGGHGFAVLGALPLVAVGDFPAWFGGDAIAVAMWCFAAAAAGIGVGETVWFPLLRGYVEPARIGRFFGMIRSGWHLTLILYFLGSHAWLARHPGDFGPLFAAGALCGGLRVLLIARLPERSERTGERIRVRDALALLREPTMRRYLLGSCAASAARTATIPFAIVMASRELGLSEAQVVYTAVATYAGGLVSLYLWGSAVDRFGPEPIFRWTSLGMAALVCGLGFIDPGWVALMAIVGFFFLHAVLWAGFGVADTHVLFDLTPSHAPTRALVLGSVSVGVVAAAAPALSGWLLEWGLATTTDGLSVYRTFFLAAAALQAMAFWPLRVFRKSAAFERAS